MQYAIVYRPGAAWISGKLPDQQALNAHIAFIQDLRFQRALIETGPFMSDSSEVTVIEVTNEAEARSILARDPAVISGVLRAELTPWNVVFGLDASGHYPTKV